jgi:phosphoribosylanthranilate isomerase
MQNFEQLGKELERRGKADDIKRLAESEDGLKLAGMLNAQQIQQAAKTGDTEALKSLLSSVLQTQEGKRLAENVRKMMQS